jgi:hypothetical protein
MPSAMVMAYDFTGRTITPGGGVPADPQRVAAMLARLRAALPADVRLVRAGWKRPAAGRRSPLATRRCWNCIRG